MDNGYYWVKLVDSDRWRIGRWVRHREDSSAVWQLFGEDHWRGEQQILVVGPEISLPDIGNDAPSRCPDCHNDELELIDGNFGTGVFSPDGTEQTAHETGYLCQVCQYVWSPEDLEVWRLIEKDIEDMRQIPDPEPNVNALERWLS